MFLHLAKAYGLDPFAKDIWFIKDRTGTPIIMTSRDGYLKIANRDENYDGMDADVVYQGDKFNKLKDGVEHVYETKNRGNPVGAYAMVYRKDRTRPVYVYAPFNDYRKNNPVWNQYPHAMILKVAEAILDKTTISSYINPQFVIAHLDKDQGKYTADSLLSKEYLPYRSQLATLGVTTFDEEKLKELISSEQFINEQDATENIKLINYLSSVYDLQEHKEETLMWLQNTPFVLTEREKMLRPGQVCFPNINNGDSKDIETICNSVYQSLSESDLRWLREVGVSDMSDTSIIDTGKLFEDGYITENNAIEIGRDIFKLHKEAKLNDHHYDLLRYNMSVISQKGSLKQSCDMYLSDKYKPELPIEKYVDIDMFLSEKYICDTDSLSEWKAFLEKIGLSQSLSLKRMVISKFISEKDNVVFNDFIDSICNIDGQRPATIFIRNELYSGECLS